MNEFKQSNISNSIASNTIPEKRINNKYRIHINWEKGIGSRNDGKRSFEIGVTMAVDISRKTSPVLKETIVQLKDVSRKSESVFWRDIAERLTRGRRRYASVDLGKIERLCAEGDIVVVPGSVLGGGKIEKKITISALKFSSSAIAKIATAGGKSRSLTDLAEENPKGLNIKIIR